MEIIPHEGISITSVVRGIIGMCSVIFIAYLLSNNKKRIDWKTIIIGLSSQLIIAVAVLKIEFVRLVFEKIGQGFLAIVTFTNQGSRILFGDLADSSKYGEIFVFPSIASNYFLFCPYICIILLSHYTKCCVWISLDDD
jgi:CNT family concentrative nucleoside transporter